MKHRRTGCRDPGLCYRGGSGSSAASVQAAILRAGGTWTAPVSLAPSNSAMQITAAAGHALAIWAGGSNPLTAATEPVT